MSCVRSARPKYSIIIPARNGVDYLPTCVQTVIDQNYSDYELIISDDHSSDGTKQYLSSLSHPNITIIEPPEALSMTEHWEWALSHAKGEWLIFVGQDDGLQPYFFHLSDRLVEFADRKKLRLIASERAYYFWKGCGLVYGDIAVGYAATNRIEIHNSKAEALKALFGIQDYFVLPQMYTTSLFKRSLIDEAATKQGGKVFLAHPQDANLAAIACSLDKSYLRTFIPLGWVGTSLRSAGMAVSFGAREEGGSEVLSGLAALKSEYEKKIVNSGYKYPSYAGDFSFGDGSIYFWQALLQTQSLRSAALNRVLVSPVFKLVMFGCVLSRLVRENKLCSHQLMFSNILKSNNCNYSMVYVANLFVSVCAIVWKPFSYAVRAVNKAKHIVFGTRVVYRVNWSDGRDIDMKKASGVVMDLMVQKNWIETIE